MAITTWRYNIGVVILNQLTPEEIQLLFSSGFKDNPYPERDRALFAVCLYTACRINEACTLKTKDVYIGKGVVRDQLIVATQNVRLNGTKIRAIA